MFLDDIDRVQGGFEIALMGGSDNVEPDHEVVHVFGCERLAHQTFLLLGYHPFFLLSASLFVSSKKRSLARKGFPSDSFRYWAALSAVQLVTDATVAMSA